MRLRHNTAALANQYKQGEHICVLFRTQDEQRAISAEYLVDGLQRGERCLYVAASDEALADFRTVLRAAGIDVTAALASSAFVEGLHADVHLQGGTFDCERMLRLLNEALEAALNDGFTGLRCCGDMSWLLDEPPGHAAVVEYEALLNQFFRANRAEAMCLYDQERLPAGLLDHALATHSSVVVRHRHKPNPFYEAADVARTRKAKPADLLRKIGILRAQ